MAKLNIVLFEPEIPANTGNIGRTCVATGTRLHLIEPLGFRLNEKALKRAGMDYWKDLDVTTYIDYADFLEKNPGAKIYMATTKAKKTYTEVAYEPDCYYVWKRKCRDPGRNFGRESGDGDPYPDDQRYPLPESRQFCGDRALRGTSPEPLRSYAAGRRPAPAALEGIAAEVFLMCKRNALKNIVRKIRQPMAYYFLQNYFCNVHLHIYKISVTFCSCCMAV